MPPQENFSNRFNSTQKRLQEGAKERKRAQRRKNCKQPGLKQSGFGTPKKHLGRLHLAREDHPNFEKTLREYGLKFGFPPIPGVAPRMALKVDQKTSGVWRAEATPIFSPDPPILAFFSLHSSFCDFLAVSCIFALFSKDFKGSAERKSLAFFGASSLS